MLNGKRNLTSFQMTMTGTKFWYHKTSFSSRAQECNYKILSKGYHCSTILYHMNPSISNLYWRCHSAFGTMTHIWGTCLRMTLFGSKSCKYFTNWQVIRYIIPLNILYSTWSLVHTNKSNRRTNYYLWKQVTTHYSFVNGLGVCTRCQLERMCVASFHSISEFMTYLMNVLQIVRFTHLKQASMGGLQVVFGSEWAYL